MMFEWRFLHPAFLLLIPLPLIWLVWTLWRGRATPAVTYSGVADIARVGRTWRVRLLGMLPVLRTLVLILGIAALARPQYGHVERNRTALGIDISLVLDVSGSMDLPDFRPNRLEASKRVLKDFIDRRINDRMHFIIFGTEAHLLCPPTFDREALRGFVDVVTQNTLSREQRMTAIGDGLGLAVRTLRDSDADSRVVLLLTDGENNAGTLTPIQAAEIARTFGIRVYPIAMGSSGVIPIEQRDAFGRIYIERVDSSFDIEPLKEIARITGGRLFIADDMEELEEVYRQIDELERSEISISEFEDYDERFHWLWFPALAILGFEFLLRAFLLGRLP